jgi:tetratricopeptide (TPR) repeat protein
MRSPGPLRLLAVVALLWPARLWAADEGKAGPSPFAPALRAMSEGRFRTALDALTSLANAGNRTPELFDLRAQVWLAMGDPDNAERDWQRAASLDPLATGPRLSLGRLYTSRALWPEAVAAYREVLLTQPRNVEAILGLFNALQRSGRTVGARKLLETAAGVIDDSRIQERWAQVASELGRPADAERALKQIVQRVNGSAKRDVLKKLASLYTAQDRPGEALASLREALAIEAASGGVTGETYDLARQPADRLVQEALTSAGRSLRDLDEGKLTREEAFERLQSIRSELADLEGFAGEVTPPTDRARAHAARAYAYSLAEEAVVDALTYVDLGEDDWRGKFGATRDAARAELSRLARSSATGG